MPTLLQINTCLGVGSTGRIVESIGTMMKQCGWDCYVVHGARYVGESQLTSIKTGSKFQTYLHALGSMLCDRHGMFSSLQTRNVIRNLRELKPDIIHLHCIHGYFINYRILFQFLCEINVPVVWTFHDCWPFTGHCAHFDNAGCYKWITGCHACKLLQCYPKSLFVDNSANNWIQKRESFTSVNNMSIVTVSRWLEDMTKQSFMQNYSISTIYNGVDLSVFKPVENDIRRQYDISPDDAVLLGVATAWGVDKGINEFIRLSAEPGIRVVLIGVSAKLKKKLPLNIIAIGRTESKHELAEFYSAADMLVNPTYNDSFPTVNLEALACGTPVITYKTGGSPEAITEETGIVINKGDYPGLLKAVRFFIDTSFKLNRSISCRRRAEECFDMNKQFDEYRKLYENLSNHSR